MVRFTAAVEVAAPADAVWSALVDWPAHGRWIPLTRMTVLTGSGEGVGARFVARTGVGVVGFDDLMEVTRWEPPADGGAGHCRVAKRGRVVLGAAWFDVVPLAARRSRVEWTEDVEVRPVPLTRPLAAVVGPLARRAFVRALRRMATEVQESTSAGEGGNE